MSDKCQNSRIEKKERLRLFVFVKRNVLKKKARPKSQEWSEEIPAIFYVLKIRLGSPPH